VTVTGVTKDPEAMTMTISARFGAPIARVWEIWSDPRRLERWWGPPEYPATVLEHDLSVGGTVAYALTGAAGDQHRGVWRVLEVDPPRSLEIEDRFADENGKPNAEMPAIVMRVTLTETPSGTDMAIVTQFPSVEAMERLLAMGMEAGITSSVAQIDELFASESSGALRSR
jgi:uncharacterized protein YndB with AHSA1/START domain